MVRAENIYTRNIIKTEWVIFRNVYLYTYMDILHNKGKDVKLEQKDKRRDNVKQS